MIELLNSIKKALLDDAAALGIKIADGGCGSYDVYREWVGRRKGMIDSIRSIDEQTRKFQGEDESETD